LRRGSSRGGAETWPATDPEGAVSFRGGATRLRCAGGAACGERPCGRGGSAIGPDCRYARGSDGSTVSWATLPCSRARTDHEPSGCRGVRQPGRCSRTRAGDGRTDEGLRGTLPASSITSFRYPTRRFDPPLRNPNLAHGRAKSRKWIGFLQEYWTGLSYGLLSSRTLHPPTQGEASVWEGVGQTRVSTRRYA
jgi:hypothetical protein